MGVLAAVGGGATVWLRNGNASDADQNRILVAPFNLLPGVQFATWDGTDLWLQTLQYVVTRQLDGVGPLTTVDAATVTRAWKGRVDATNARVLARDLEAGLVVYGDIVRDATDSIRVRAQLMELGSGTTIDSVSVTGDEGRPDRLAAALALAVPDPLRRVRPITATSNAGLRSQSPMAVKEFARGEGFYRETQRDSACVRGRSIDVSAGTTAFC